MFGKPTSICLGNIGKAGILKQSKNQPKRSHLAERSKQVTIGQGIVDWNEFFKAAKNAE